MSRYDDLDDAIRRALLCGERKFSGIRSNKHVIAHTQWKRDPDRLVDRRLQAMRKRGVISFVKGTGWVVGEEVAR